MTTKPTVSIHINEQPLTLPATATVLQGAQWAGKTIPTLCSTPWFPHHGTCRLCLVAVAGSSQWVAACHTQVTDGAHYTTDSPALADYRRQTLRLLLAGHPPCDQCPSLGRCRLEPHARQFNLHHGQIPPLDEAPCRPSLNHPLIVFTANLCIHCGLCRQACAEVQGEDVLGFLGRGYLSSTVPHSLEESGCVACGACLTVCPTLALASRQESAQTADQEITTTCPYCAIGCQLTMATRENRLLRVTPALHGSANWGQACVKGRFGQAFVTAADRLTTPLLRNDHGELQEIPLTAAVDIIAARYRQLRDTNDPHAFAAISSARCTNEENYLIQKFTRVVMNSNSVDNCARVCHSPSAYALGTALGTGAGAYRLEDVAEAEVILLFGANPTEAHPVLGARIKQAVRRGCRLIVVDPRRTQLARLAHLHLAVRPGHNLALLNALQWVLLTENLINHPFVAAYGENLSPWQAALHGCSPEWAASTCGVAASLIRQAARTYAQANKALILWGLGVTESCQGTLTAFALVNLAILTGHVGRPGTGVGPIRGQNNVQGACDMGALPNVFSDYRPITDPQARQEHLAVWGKLPPLTPGYRIGDMWEAALAGKLKMLHVIAQDVVQSDPAVATVIQAVKSLEFLVVQDLFLSETGRYAHVVLPAAAYLEKSGTFVNSDRRIQRVRQVLQPPVGVYSDGDLLVAIAKGMGETLGHDLPLDPAGVMAEIVTLTPNWAGVTYEKLAANGFIQWPCLDSDHQGTPILHQDGQFMRGKARLTPTPWQEAPSPLSPAFPLVLTTGRALNHYNVGSMTRRTPIQQLSRAQEERVRIHPQDAHNLGIADGQWVQVVSRHGGVTVRGEITDETPPGVVFMTFHFPATRTNRLIGAQADSFTRCPEYKVTAVALVAVSPTATADKYPGLLPAPGKPPPQG